MKYGMPHGTVLGPFLFSILGENSILYCLGWQCHTNLQQSMNINWLRALIVGYVTGKFENAPQNLRQHRNV